MKIRPLLILRSRSFNFSGGFRRLHEILKNGKSQGIDYVIVTDLKSYKNCIQMFPDYKEIFRNYKTYVFTANEKYFPSARLPEQLKPLTIYLDYFLFAQLISKVVREEKIDLVVGPSEGTNILWMSYLVGKLSNLPWTVVIHGRKYLFQKTDGISSLSPLNVLKHIRKHQLKKKNSIISQIGFGIELLCYLKIAEKSLILTVNNSLRDEIRSLNPKINFHVIKPGNGVDLKQFNENNRSLNLYDALFFSRLMPEKGLFDLISIWKEVIKKNPNAKLAVAGIVEDQKYVDSFLKLIKQSDLSNNIIFLGPQEKNSIFDLIRSSKLVIYPSTFDTFSLVIIESLACGRPVITYDVPVFRDLFHECKSVLRCPVKDMKSVSNTVLSLLQNENLVNDLSNEAIKFAHNYDWKTVVQAEKKAYFKTLDWFNLEH